ncbi:hypothetical protein I316_02595 [Kwoniella heveanensis BCC8398]|uniref:Uncharacterized protein n=1 Tax=Kwoniella heveanensis BCC8398 TaxID=1296120 RepID=A0A1B9GWZ0_9TREE|nr:hypothetical protein I316_02595 [Kwoniella heveanensis BCC8398]
MSKIKVSSSTGKNYTIHLNPPDPMPLPPDGLPDVITGDAEPQRPSDHSSTLSPSSPAASPIRRKQDVDTRMKVDGSIDQGTSKESISPFHTPSPPSPMIGSARAPEPHSEIHLSSKKRKRKTPSDLAREKAELERRDRCKHLLAVIIAHKTGKEVAAEVGLPGVVSLLGLSA